MRSRSGALAVFLLIATAVLARGATLDEATVYASPGGSDSSDGSRDAPVRSLFRALDLASRTGRLVVRLAVGEYPVDAGLTLSQGITLLGGLEPGTWSSAGPGLRSELVPSSRFRATNAVLSAAVGAVTISGIALSDGAGTPSALLALSGTALAARDVSFTIRGEATRTALSASGASVTISDSTFTAERAGAATLAAISGGTATMTGCTFRGPPQAADFACLGVSAAARVEVAGSVLDPGSGAKLRGIRAVGSSVTLATSHVASGAGRLESAAVDVRGGTFAASNCDFTASSEATVPACLIGEGSAVTIEGSRMEVSGQSGAAGLSVTGGSLTIRASRLSGGTTAEYLYLVYAVAAELLIEETILAGGDTGDLVDILVRDSTLEVLNATIAAGRGRLGVTAIAGHGSGRLRVSASVLAAPSSAAGPALIVRRPGRGLPEGLEIQSCCFGGWDRLAGFDPASGVRDVTDVDALNDLDGDPYGGGLDGCIAEDPAVTFRGEGDYRLSPDSACTAAGIGARTEGE